MTKIISALIGFVLMLPSLSNATLIIPSTVSATGSYSNSENLINDGFIPTERTAWTASSNVYWNGTVTTFMLDFGQLYNVNDVLVSVDNNDYLTVDWSIDLSSWSNLFNINSSYGEVTWGMDTLSTDNLNSEYVSNIDFSSVQARYLRIKATGGDNSYAIGEFQAFGSKVSSVPEPSTLTIFALGVIGLASRRLKK